MFTQFGKNLKDLERDQKRVIKIIIWMKKSSMQNHKNTIVVKAALILCKKGYYRTVAESSFLTP